MAGRPIEDIVVEVYGGSYHEIHSTEMAFRVASALAIQDAARKRVE